MKTKELISKLENYNAWRRGYHDDMPDTFHIGEWIDEACKKLNKKDKEIKEVRNKAKEAQYESEQQSRLLGISAEREYALRGKIFELERKILQLEAK